MKDGRVLCCESVYQTISYMYRLCIVHKLVRVNIELVLVLNIL